MSRIASQATGETFAASPAPRRACATPAVEIVIPVHNEQRVLAASVRELHRYLASEFTFAFQITIADNASTDATPEIAAALARDLAEVAVLQVDQQGRGRAPTWSRIWTRTCPPSFRRFRPYCCRSCRCAATSRSGHGSHLGPV
jgi:hypothetical protein